jgi:parvulin-like peptidyl-prolyl isomerase
MKRRDCLLTMAIYGGLLATMAARGEEPAAVGIDAPARDSVVARVGKIPVYRSEFEAALKRTGIAGVPSAEQRRRLEAELLEQLVNERLLQQVVAAEKVEVDEDEVSKIVVRMRSQLSDRRIELDTFLAQNGRDEQSLREQVKLELALKKMLAAELTSDSLAAAFDKHRREIDGTRLRASHIVLRPDPARGSDALPALIRKADDIRREILKGTISFADAAKRHSAGPSRRQGGDIGYFPRSGVMHEDFAREAFSLAKGDVSKPFATPSGVHILMVTGVEPGNGSAEGLRPQLEKLVVQRAIRGLLERGRSTTQITYSPGVAHFDGQPDRRIVVEP